MMHTAVYFQFISEGERATHDEIDLEFLGNETGQPYTLHTNIFVNGTGNKEQQFRIPFDETTTEMIGFHTYSIIWSSWHILLLVDGTPIREFRNHTSGGVAYPSTQRMGLYGSLWNGDGWATQGGRVKTDWTKAPFVAQYRNFTATTSSPGGYYYDDHEMDGSAQQKMKEIRDKYMIYNYCTDEKNFINGTAPPQCSMPGTG
ncbi:unnamed protein product [Alopecurus aequalis]